MFDVARYESDLEDERRLFYVAITRAKDLLVVSYFSKMKKAMPRSEFIDDMNLSVSVDLGDGKPVPDVTLYPSVADEDIQTFTASEIITYSICPHMYLLREIWGYQPQFDQAIGYGNGMHYCLRCASELINKDGYSPCDAVAKSVDEDFHMPFVGHDFFDALRKSARNRLVSFAEKYGNDFKRIEEVEYRLEFALRNATIMGKVDVILNDAGKMEVRDYKSSEETRSFDEIATQVRLYTAGLQSMGRPITSGSVAYLDEPTVKPVDVSKTAVSNEVNNAENLVRSIIKRNFKPKSGENCGRCDQKEICRWKS